MIMSKLYSDTMHMPTRHNQCPRSGCMVAGGSGLRSFLCRVSSSCILTDEIDSTALHQDQPWYGSSLNLIETLTELSPSSTWSNE